MNELLEKILDELADMNMRISRFEGDDLDVEWNDCQRRLSVMYTDSQNLQEKQS